MSTSCWVKNDWEILSSKWSGQKNFQSFKIPTVHSALVIPIDTYSVYLLIDRWRKVVDKIFKFERLRGDRYKPNTIVLHSSKSTAFKLVPVKGNRLHCHQLFLIQETFLIILKFNLHRFNSIHLREMLRFISLTLFLFSQVHGSFHGKLYY